MSDRPTLRTDGQTFDQNGYRPTGADGEILSVPVEFAHTLERELAAAQAENLEQSRLLGMSAEREADLRGELEREKWRAESLGTHTRDLGVQLTAARDERDRYLSECNRLHDELKAERKASFRDERDRLVAALKGISSASPAKWDVPRDEFKHDFEPWAKNVASAALAAVRDSGNANCPSVGDNQNQDR